MTLLELLVKELPVRGGWPIGSDECRKSPGGPVEFNYIGSEYSFHTNDVDGNIIHHVNIREYLMEISGKSEEVSSQQPVWNGEGLPPVGCDVEFCLDTDKYRVHGNIPENGQVVNVVAHKQTTDGNPVAVVYWDDHGGGRAAAFINAAFSPIRTEADRKRDESIEAIRLATAGADQDKPFNEAIYDAIAAGKIPGVELSK